MRLTAQELPGKEKDYLKGVGYFHIQIIVVHVSKEVSGDSVLWLFDPVPENR